LWAGRQKTAEEDIAPPNDDTAMKQAEDELKRAELELQRNEIVSRIDAEKKIRKLSTKPKSLSSS